MSHSTDTATGAASEAFNFAAHLVEVNAARASKLAYVDDLESLSYGALAEQIRSAAASLLATGVRREERVLLLMHDCIDWPIAFLGALYAGIVTVAVNTLLTADDYAYMLEHCNAQGALVSAALLPTFREAWQKSALSRNGKSIPVWVSRASEAPALQANEKSMRDALAAVSAEHKATLAAADTQQDDIGFWLYSSGSTGKPKGAVHTHASPRYTAEKYGKAVLGLCESDVCFSAAKLFFAYGLGNALSFPLSVGACVVLMPDRPTPEAVFKRWLESDPCRKPTVFFGAPTGYAGILAHPALPTKEQVSLRMCSSAGEALPAEIGEKFTAHFGCEIIDGIGSTEMLHIYLSNIPGKVRYGTTGWPVAGYEIALRGEDGLAVADGEIGDLYIRGASSALMYWRNRAKSNDTFQGAWTKSGDKYVRNADGTYTYAGRSDDMLKVSGIYVSPFEVEATLVQHAAVLECAVIGVEDADGLTKTKAYVVKKDGHEVSEEALKAFVKERLAAYKYPRSIVFIEQLPKTATGKIQRFRLRELEAKAQR